MPGGGEGRNALRLSALGLLLDLDHQRVTTAAAVQLLRLSAAKYFGS
jgi:hypothetical protein